MSDLPETAWWSYLRNLAETRILLRSATRSGLLRLTSRALTLGTGVLGARQLWSLPLADIESIELSTATASHGVGLRIRTGQQGLFAVEGVSPAAARRLCELVGTLRAVYTRSRRI